jgi:hypothetical protein
MTSPEVIRTLPVIFSAVRCQVSTAALFNLYASFTPPVVQYLPLRRALTNNVRIRCTWRSPGAPGIRLLETGRTCHSQGAPVDCRCTSITPGAPVKIAGAPGDARCALGMPGAPGIRAFETGRTCHSQGAPVDRRWISITPGASLEYQGHHGRRQGLGL